jgi:sulfhydrogenase subunit beta (sulfur reductase)
MEKRSIKKDALAGIIKKVAGDMLVYAPVKEEDGVFFRVLGAGMEPQTQYANTKNAPKNIFFPHTEKMMKYTRTDKGMEFSGAAEDAKDAVLFGARPCDARSFMLLDMLFDQEKYKDPFYCDKREKTIIVTQACIHPPYSTCFCTSVDGSPMSEAGSDVMLTDVGDGYLVEFFTPKGEKLLKYFGDAKPDASVDEKKKAIAEKAASEIVSRIPAKEIKPILDVNFEHPFWNTIHQRCLACGTCTFLCPTCHCFDISDEVKYADGIRIRNWDSCMFPMFTHETSGHNPRPSQKERWRQRTMHKFKYYIDMFNAISCVGCGRCVMYCPVNIDIRKIVTDISKL